MLSNKEIQSLERHSAAMEQLTRDLKSGAGKELRKEREALEKAVGGKKRLDEADRVFDDFVKQGEKIVQKAEGDAADILAAARRDAGRIKDEAVASAASARADRIALDKKTKEFEGKIAGANALSGKLAERERIITEREEALDRRKADLDALGMELDLREQEVRRMEEWARSRPA